MAVYDRAAGFFDQPAVSFLQKRQLDILICVALPLALLILASGFGPSILMDDALISFHYAQNLSQGHGLVWNLGEPPTQGFTNMSFVLLAALGIRLGLSPILVAYSLNGLGIAATLISLRLLAGRLFPQNRLLSLLPVLLVSLSWYHYANALSGLETLFCTGLIFMTCAFALRYLETGQSRYFAALLAAGFAACLTRPDSVPFVGLWFLMLWFARPAKRRQVLAGIGLFAAAGLIYLIFLTLYFGNPLPNPFYIKVNSGHVLPGLSYIRNFLLAVMLPAAIPALPAVRLIHKRSAWLSVLPYLAVFFLPLFYVFVDPLQGGDFRFLHPATCFILFLAGVGLSDVILDLTARQQAPARVRLKVSARYVLTMSAVIVFIVMVGLTTVEALIMRVKLGAASQLPLTPYVQTAVAVATIPDIQNALVAYGDAGALPYYAGVRFLDVVGLNDNTIAREANRRGAGWVIEYILGRAPDMIGFYSSPDGQIFNEAHGVIGAAYSELYRHPQFQDNYTFVGGLTYNDFTVNNWFVRRDSAYAAALREAIRSVADRRDMQFTP